MQAVTPGSAAAAGSVICPAHKGPRLRLQQDASPSPHAPASESGTNDTRLVVISCDRSPLIYWTPVLGEVCFQSVSVHFY